MILFLMPMNTITQLTQWQQHSQVLLTTNNIAADITCELLLELLVAFTSHNWPHLKSSGFDTFRNRQPDRKPTDLVLVQLRWVVKLFALLKTGLRLHSSQLHSTKQLRWILQWEVAFKKLYYLLIIIRNYLLFKNLSWCCCVPASTARSIG